MTQSSLLLVALVSLFGSGCQHVQEGPPAPRPIAAREQAPAPASASLTVTYREAANVFEILDNVSLWWPDKCDGEYRAYWQQRFGVTAEDEQSFASYKTIRERYFTYPAEPPKGEVDVFGRAKPADRIAEAFYEASSLDAAFTTLATFASTADIAAIRAFVERQRPRWEALVAESGAFTEIAKTLQASLDRAGATAWLARTAAFYSALSVPRFTVLYVWWPPVENTTANNRGSTLLLKYNPARHRDDAIHDVDIPIHEYVHWVSSHQSEERRRTLSKAFVARCDVGAKIKPVKILEEPLAVALQRVFVSEVDPKRLDFASGWYGGDPWVGTFAKLIYPLVKQWRDNGRTLDEPLMTAMGKTCAQLKAVASTLQ